MAQFNTFFFYLVSLLNWWNLRCCCGCCYCWKAATKIGESTRQKVAASAAAPYAKKLRHRCCYCCWVFQNIISVELITKAFAIVVAAACSCCYYCCCCCNNKERESNWAACNAKSLGIAIDKQQQQTCCTKKACNSDKERERESTRVREIACASETMREQRAWVSETTLSSRKLLRIGHLKAVNNNYGQVLVSLSLSLSLSLCMSLFLPLTRTRVCRSIKSLLKLLEHSQSLRHTHSFCPSLTHS